MSIIKQKAVTEKGHAKNLRDYINDKDALLRDFQRIANPTRWSDEMAGFRECFGHDKPYRKGAENTIMYHQVIAFLPDECSMNGGKMTPELCMQYAKEYAETRYPDQQIAFALHKEHCDEDGIDRYAVHMAINRSNLATHNRLWEGTGAQAKHARAAAIRRMDAKWGLKQVEKGVPNSKIHRQQPQRRGIEKQIIDRAKARNADPARASYKYNLRELCRIFRDRSTSLGEYRDMLAEWGVETEIRDGKVYAIDTDNRKYTFSLARLDRSLTINGLEAAFKRNDGDIRMASLEKELQEKQRQIETYAAIKKDYLDVVAERYRDYCALVRANKGAKFDDLPQIKMPRVPSALEKDMSVKRTVLSYVAKGDELRVKLAGDTLLARDKKAGGSGFQQGGSGIDRNAPAREVKREGKDR